MADTSETRKKESQKWKRRDFDFFSLHAQSTPVRRPHHRKSIRGKQSKAITTNTKNPKDE